MAIVNGTTGADFWTISDRSSATTLNARNGGIFDINGNTGNDTLSLTVAGQLSYTKNLPLSGFHIGAAVDGVITISGSSANGASFTFHLTSVETLEYYDSASKSYKTITLDYGAPADTTAPSFFSAAVNGTTLVLSYNETLNASAPAASTFSVPGHTVTGVSISGQTVTLTLATPVAYGESVTVSYTDPAPATNDTTGVIQDVAGNDALSLGATTVRNDTPVPADTTAPVFFAATVNGTVLVMSYTEANTLDGTNIPAAGTFSVSGHTVNSVAVNAAAKTVTLTLGTPVANGEVVTVSYTDPAGNNPTGVIQDVAGNDAVSLVGGAVTNATPAPAPDTTAPVFGSATVNGSTLVMSYTDANNLGSAAPAASAFAVSGHTVTGVAVNTTAKTVSLTLATPVVNGEAVTVSYTDPTGGNDGNAIQDVAGNDALSLGATTVTNNTPVPADTTAPVFASATVNGSTLVMNYTDTNNLGTAAPATSAFTVPGHIVSGVAVNTTAKTVTLTLATPVANGESVTVSYNDPTAGNDANAIQDAAGNDAASLVGRAVTNTTPAPAPDTTAPVFGSAAVNGSTLVMSYTDANNLGSATPAASAFAVSGHAVTGVAVNTTAKTVSLTLATSVVNGEAVTVAYTDPTGGNDVNAIQDVAGNDAASLGATAVTNNTPVPPDTTAPVFASAAVNGSTLVMSYTDANMLDGSHLPAASAFSVPGHTVNSVAVNAAAKTITLTLGTGVLNGDTVTVAYTDLTAGNDSDAIQDLAGNDAASLSSTAVTNSTPLDTTPPTVTNFTPADNAVGIAVGSNIDVLFSELIDRGTGTIEIHSDSAAGALVESYNAATSSNLSISGNTLSINPANNLVQGTHYFVTFNPGTVHDLSGNGYAGTSSYDFTSADPFAAADSHSGSDSGVVIAGVAGLGVLAWALFF